MSNFIPNNIITTNLKDPSWITRDLKNMTRRQNRMCKNFKRHGGKEADITSVKTFRLTCFDAINTAKVNYLKIQCQILEHFLKSLLENIKQSDE